ncbi:MAG: tetraacyldisaccharide 4'-kinase [Nitrospirota bacterium]
MYGRKRSPVAGALLYGLSLAYGMAVKIRTAAYAAGLFRTKRLPCRVISVGNITLGGTGKTPTVICIAGLLSNRGRRPLVLSRGYGRADESRTTVVSDGASFIVDAAAGGDEPALIAARLPQVPVVAGSDRHHAGTIALQRFHPDVVVLDDGYQHIRLGRDLNIALVDGADPFGNGRLFPAGILREPLEALKRADIVIITREDQAADLAALRETIGKHTTARIFTARYAPRDVVNVPSGETLPLTSLQGKVLFAFAGIARPESLVSLLRSLGAEVRALRSFPDHHPYSRNELDDMTAAASDSGAEMLMTTEKDGVRLRDMAPANLWALRIDLEVMEKDAWEKAVAG